MKKDCTYYSNKFKKLRVDHSRGLAPHKPILLLSIIELFEQGVLRQNKIPLSAELLSAFLKYWSKLNIESHRPNIAEPYYHLRSDGFWHLRAKSGFEATVQSRVRLKSIGAIRDTIEYAYLDDELYRLLQVPLSRNNLIGTLITSWFKDKASSIEQLLKINQFQNVVKELDQKGGKVYALGDEEIVDEAKYFIRDAAFRSIIITIYEYRCILCSVKAIDYYERTIIDGAHIKPFAQFHDDRIQNGIALCKNHHWAFDQGWFSIDEALKVVVSPHLKEESPNSKPLREFHGQPIMLPNSKRYMPCVEALQWHRTNRFLR